MIAAKTTLGVCLSVLLCGTVLAQAAAGPGVDANSDAAQADESQAETYDEEVLVLGRSRAFLRIQIQLAEEAVYDRFNEINSNDEFDIHCRSEVYTGSKIPRRVCQPELWRTALRRAGEESTRALQGSFAFPAAQFQNEALYKSHLMEQELRRLIQEDEQLLQAVTHLANLTETINEHDGTTRLSPTASETVVSADEEPLPYGAQIMASVWIRRDPWEHRLTHRVFTIANVFGDIRAVDLDCGRQSSRIRFEPGAEWTLPDGWEDCSVTIEAEPGTTFALYEFL
jgi:hypothetical protein